MPLIFGTTGATGASKSHRSRRSHLSSPFCFLLSRSPRSTWVALRDEPPHRGAREIAAGLPIAVALSIRATTGPDFRAYSIIPRTQAFDPGCEGPPASQDRAARLGAAGAAGAPQVAGATGDSSFAFRPPELPEALQLHLGLTDVRMQTP
jgi:hypothetical protein